MMDREQQTAGRTAARVKPYSLQHGSVLSRQTSRGSLRFVLHFLPERSFIKASDIYCVQARFRTHGALRQDLESPIIPVPFCASETQPQRIVMIEYRLQSTHKVLAFQFGRDLQHNRLAEAMQRA